MIKFDYNYAILLDIWRNGEDLIFFDLDILYWGGGVNHPFRRTFSRLIYHLYTIFILLYCRMPLYICNL